VSLSHTVSRSIGFTSNNVSADDALSSIKITSITVGLGRRVKWPDDFFTLSNSISYRNYELYDSDVNDLYPGIGERDFGFANGTSNSITFNTILARNSIDNPMFPRNGSSVSLEVNLTPPFSLFNGIDYETAPRAERYKWVEYQKWMLDTKFYTQLAKNLVLESRAHFGFIGSYGDKPVNTPFERFVMGGSGLAGQSFIVARDIIGLRGYEDNSLEPFDVKNQARGGIAYNKFTMELRYLVSPNPSATIYGLGFAEAGNTVADFAKYNPFDLYKSAGFGARIFMPAFGLLGIDWGYGFDTLPGQTERSGPQFHFTIGQQIR
jgi:outer membrane protein insertion porin family